MKLRILREEKNLTHKELATIIGRSTNSVSMWELGKTLPRLSSIKKMQEVFGKENISIHDFYS